MQPLACSPRGRQHRKPIAPSDGIWDARKCRHLSRHVERLYGEPAPYAAVSTIKRIGMRIRKWDAFFAPHQLRDRTPDHDTDNRHPNGKTEMPPNVPPRLAPCKAYAFRPIRCPKHYLFDVAHVRRTSSALPAARDLEKMDSASYDWQLSSYGRLPPGRSYSGG